VYLARCVRGRLYSRLVALKKVRNYVGQVSWVVVLVFSLQDGFVYLSKEEHCTYTGVYRPAPDPAPSRHFVLVCRVLYTRCNVSSTRTVYAW
jgi:hypothetical protein